MKEKLISNSAIQTMQIAKNFARKLRGGETVILVGDLGAGKTTFTKGIAKGLGVGDDILSPTFNIIKEYKGSFLFLFHIDMYRIDDEDEIENLGLMDLFGEDSVVVIEWNKCKNIPSKDVYEVSIEIKENGNREISLLKIK